MVLCCVVPAAGLGHDMAASHSSSGSWMCLLCRNAPGFGMCFLLWVISLLWPCLVDLSSPVPSPPSPPRSPDHACIGAQYKPVQEAEQLENEEFALFSCLLTLFPYGSFGTGGALVPDFTPLVGSVVLGNQGQAPVSSPPGFAQLSLSKAKLSVMAGRSRVKI